MKQAIRVVIVEDNPAIRESLQTIFSGTQDFKIVSTFPDAESAVKKLPALEPNLVLMDINLPGMSGIECMRSLKAKIPGLKVIMVTVYDDNDNLFQSLVAGADGYLLKHMPARKLIESVREIAVGGAPISSQMARRMVEYFHCLKGDSTQTAPASAASAKLAVDGLSDRECEILGKLAEGLVPKLVAAEFGISLETVRTHVSNIYQKLHVHSRTEAVLKYLGRSSDGSAC